MLKQHQTLALKIVGATLITQAGFATAVLRRAFTLENKAIALGQVMHAHLDILTDEDHKHLLNAGINFRK